MATSDEILAKLEEIKGIVANLNDDGTVPGQIVRVVNGLSEIDGNLGLVSAGEFRAGNRETPGQGFSGVRIAYPAMTYDSEDWHIVGINNDTIQFGLRATDGVAMFGAGKHELRADGYFIEMGSGNTNTILWYDPDTGDPPSVTTIGYIGTTGIGTSPNIHGSLEYNVYARGTADDPVHTFIVHVPGETTRNFQVNKNGVAFTDKGDPLFYLLNSEFVLNVSGKDIDTRVEGNTETHLLFVDAGLDRVAIGHAAPDTILDINGAFTFRELSADPSNPDEGSAVMWMSDGTGSGADGDIMMAITAGGVTKTATLVDFSAV